MQVRYIGPFDAVELEAADKAWIEVRHGETVDLPDDLATSLLEQPANWEAVSGGARKRAETTPNPDADQAEDTTTIPEEG